MIKKHEGTPETADYNTTSFIRLHGSKETDDFSKHRHNAIEIIMPFRGSYDVIVSDVVYELEECGILIIPAGDMHEIRTPRIPGERIILQFDSMLLKGTKGLAHASFIFFKPWMITPDDEPELHREIKALLLDIMRENTDKQEYCEAAITAKLINAVILMARRQRENTDGVFAEHLVRRKAHIVNFNRCIEYINTHYKDDLSLEFIAGIAGFSKFHFTRWFKQFAGMSFYEYLTQVRIKVAEAMLAGSETAITEIALESGFQSIATFNRVFKHNKKLTPTEFREIKQKTNARITDILSV